MDNEPNRRNVLQGLSAVAVAGVVPAPAVPAPDWHYRSATDLVAALAAKSVSSRELVDLAIARIEALDPKINAIVVRDFAAAREAAAAADAARDRGERWPLLGLPMTVKESFNLAGLPTTWGDPVFKDWRPTEDALVVSRLKAAGAIILGKTNVPLNLADWQSYNEIYGTTNNPWNLARTPGGSSGGAAAALAAGFVPLEIGSDIGGSLRAPAHYCGVYGHKSTVALVPFRGGGPPKTPAIPSQNELAVFGPMARSAADLALALSVVAGPDELSDGIGYKLALPPPRHTELRDYRVLLIDSHPLCPTAHSVTASMERLADRLAASGCTVARTSPKMPNLAITAVLYVKLLMAFLSAEMPAEARRPIEIAAKTLPPDDQTLRASYIRGITITHPDWVQASYMRNGFRQRWQALFQDFDVILCPAMPTPAFPHDHSPERQRRLDIDGVSITYDDQIVWASIATLCGLPATAAPIGQSEDGLPIGVQIIGGYFEDYTTIAFAGLMERDYGGFVPRRDGKPTFSESQLAPSTQPLPPPNHPGPKYWQNP